VTSSKIKANIEDFKGESSYRKVRETAREDLEKKLIINRMKNNKYAFKYGRMEKNLHFYCLE
jgi:hypothetical protein